MIINATNLQALRRSFKALATVGMTNAKPRWNQVAMLAPSATRENSYGFLRDIPGMREWVGDRVIQNLSESDFTIKNRAFEVTVSVKREDIEDDNLGIYRPMFEQLGESVAYSPDEIVFALLPAGFTEKCWDGKPFFATDHPVKKGVTFSNRGTKKLTGASFQEALAQMQSLKNAAGAPLRLFMGTGEAAPLLIVGPKLRATATAVVGLQRLENGSDNPNYQAANVLVLPELTDAYEEYWFLAEVSKPVKPLIFQRRKEPEFVALDNPEDPNVFHKREYIYGFDDRKAAGYSFPQLCWGSDGTTAG